MSQGLKAVQRPLSRVAIEEQTGPQQAKQSSKNPATTNNQIVFTVRLHIMQRTVLLSKFCLFFRPSVRQTRVL